MNLATIRPGSQPDFGRHIILFLSIGEANRHCAEQLEKVFDYVLTHLQLSHAVFAMRMEIA